MSGSSSTTRTRPLLSVVCASGADISGGIHRLPRCTGFKPGQFQMEARAAWIAGDLDGAGMFLNDTVCHRQAQPGALAAGLGGEEGIKDPVDILRRDAVAGIGDFHTRAGLLARRAHAERAAALHGIARVEE